MTRSRVKTRRRKRKRNIRGRNEQSNKRNASVRIFLAAVASVFASLQ